MKTKEDTGTISKRTSGKEKNIEETNTEGAIGKYSNIDNRNNNLQQYHFLNAETKLNTKNAEGHIQTTAFSQKDCSSCGYPNRISEDYEAKSRVC